MENVLKVVGSILGTVLTLGSIHLIRYLQAKSEKTILEMRDKEQKQVFEWGDKIVTTLEEEYRKSDLDGKIKSQRKFDQGVSRLNDVLMLNGLDPKYYNTAGVITHAVGKTREKGGDSHG